MEAIDLLKIQLDKLLEFKETYDEEVMSLSRAIDILIVKYYKEFLDRKTGVF